MRINIRADDSDYITHKLFVNKFFKKNYHLKKGTSSSSLKCQSLQWNQNDWFCRLSVLYYLIC